MRLHTTPPVALELKAALVRQDLSTLLPPVMAALSAEVPREVRSYRSSLLPDHPIAGGLEDVLTLAADMGPSLLGLELELEGGVFVLLSVEEACVFTAIRFPAPCEQCEDKAWGICARLAEQDLIQSAVLERVDDPLANTLPDLPLVRRGTHLSVATVELIEAHVAPLARVLALPWQRTQQVGQTLLLGRGLGLRDSNDFVASVWSHHAAMAALLGFDELDEDDLYDEVA